MSEVRYYKGTLLKVPKEGNETLEEQCRRIAGIIRLPAYYDSYREFVTDGHIFGDFDKEFTVYNGELYAVYKQSLDPDDDIFYADFLSPDSADFEFEVKYYDGGCNIHEAIEEALNRRLGYE